MDRQTKRQQNDLKKQLDYDEKKLRKQAGNVRRGLKKGKGGGRGPAVTSDNWEAMVDSDVARRKQKRPALGAIVDDLRTRAGADDELPAIDDSPDAAIVIAVSSGRCRVVKAGEELDCLIPSEIAVRQKSALAVGDRVIVEEESGVWRLRAIVPRRTVLSRPDPLNPHLQRLIAANIDVVIHVVSVKAPPLRPRLIDRYFIAIQRGGAQPVICVNKIDLLDDAARARELAPLSVYADLGVPVIACSTHNGEGLDALRAEVVGKTSALVGHSGVGKSSILNALDQQLALATNTLHRRGTGRHTTTASSLYDFGDGTYLIDTPGIREFGLWDLDRDSLRDYFPEFEEPSASCRFNDCTHLHEPGCEVKRLVEEGTLNRARYETYVRLAEDLPK